MNIYRRDKCKFITIQIKTYIKGNIFLVNYYFIKIFDSLRLQHDQVINNLIMKL